MAVAITASPKTLLRSPKPLFDVAAILHRSCGAALDAQVTRLQLWSLESCTLRIVRTHTAFRIGQEGSKANQRTGPDRERRLGGKPAFELSKDAVEENNRPTDRLQNAEQRDRDFALAWRAIWPNFTKSSMERFWHRKRNRNKVIELCTTLKERKLLVIGAVTNVHLCTKRVDSAGFV